ncbi:MAG: hypothetical protein HRU20_08750 [Pseudomonadales bacterium]|nr:hypothetical protein [Pseudomonadales bacterium]
MKKALLGMACLLIITCSWAEQAVYSNNTLEAFSESFSIYDVTHDLDQDYDSGDYLYLMGRFELGYRYNNSYLGLLYRQDAYATASASTAEIIHLNKSDKEMPANKRFPIALSANQLQSQGIIIGHTFTFISNLSIDISAQLLQAYEMTDGDIQGHIETHAEDYQGQLQLDYFYTRDAIFDRPVHNKTGQGLAIDMTLQWQISAQHQLQLNAMDLFHEVFWHDMYTTTAMLTTDRVHYDEDGKLDVRSALSGLESEKDHIQSLPTKWRLRWGYQFRQTQQLQTELFLLEQHRELRLRYWPQTEIGAYVYLSSLNTLGVGYDTGPLQLLIASDSLKRRKAHNLIVQLNGLWTF